MQKQAESISRKRAAELELMAASPELVKERPAPKKQLTLGFHRLGSI